LSDEEIEKMIKEAESNAEEDKKIRELVDAKKPSRSNYSLIRKRGCRCW
jgi:molecular chaperone DnaK